MKNKFMRVAVIMMALVLVTSCFVGGTFAKYVAGNSADDSARVAKWGVQVTVDGDGAFAETYETDDTATLTAANSVVADVDVVAPGTEGEFVSVDISGTPEVAVEVTYEATVVVTGDWVDAEGNFYCPVVVSVGGNAITGTSADELAANIKTAIDGYSDVYEANTTLEDETQLAITWAWAFEGATAADANQNGIDDTDEKDTFLGDWVIRQGATAPEISIDVAVTVEQID